MDEFERAMEHADAIAEAQAEREHADAEVIVLERYIDYSGDRLLDGPDLDLFGRPIV